VSLPASYSTEATAAAIGNQVVGLKKVTTSGTRGTEIFDKA